MYTYTRYTPGDVDVGCGQKYWKYERLAFPARGHGSSLPMRLDTFCSPRLVFITTTLGLMNRAQPLQPVVFSPVESQGVAIKRWYHRFWHAVAGSNLFRAEGLNLCWTRGSLCLNGWMNDIQMYILYTSLVEHFWLGYSWSSWRSASLEQLPRHPELHYDVGLLKKNIHFAVPSLWDLR